ncbi:MAG: hypothetical protein ACYC0M_10440 [Burkholderiales bacterium]
MSKENLKRLYHAIPFPMACQLHQRIAAGCVKKETRDMLRFALKAAKVITI